MMITFEDLNDAEKEFVMDTVSLFHIRDGTLNSDNSFGRISITPQALRNILAMAIKYGATK